MPSYLSIGLVIVGAFLMLFANKITSSKSNFQGRGRFPTKGDKKQKNLGSSVVRILGIVLVFIGVFLFIQN
jgi:hypothetical protein